MTEPYVPYSYQVEMLQPGEEQIFDEIAATMLGISKKIGERQRHTVRSVHAKSHGLLKAEVTVPDDLPEPLRQGLFAKAATYGAVMRFSTNPGDILSDHISTPRGLGLKIVGVEGEMIQGHSGEVTQDFVMVNAKTFGAPDASRFLKGLKTIDEHVNDSESFKQTVSSVAQFAERAAELFGSGSEALKNFGHRPTHPLGETFSTVVPLRYGGYFGKLELAPVSSDLVDLCGRTLENAGEWNALKDAIVGFFQQQGGRWELRAQLCTDLEKMPVEDATVRWDEARSPFITVAEITAQPQDAYSDERRIWVDELLSFNPWHCLAAHRPLGNIMRSRFKAYQASSRFRHTAEDRKIEEPRSIDEMPA